MWRLSGTLRTESARLLFTRLILHDASPRLLAWAVTVKPTGDYCGQVDSYCPEERSEICRTQLRAAEGFPRHRP